MGDGSIAGIVVRCLCGAEFTLVQWADLEFVGVQDDGVDTLIELRNCRCGSTCARRCDMANTIRLLNENAKRLRRALVRFRMIEVATAGLGKEINEIDVGSVRQESERERCLRIVKETLSSVSLPHPQLEGMGKGFWLRTLSEVIEARIKQG